MSVRLQTAPTGRVPNKIYRLHHKHTNMTENVEQPQAEVSTFPSGQYDTVGKNIIRSDPNGFLRYCLGTQDAETIQILETEQPTVNWYRADSFIHANVQGKEVIVHVEFQTHDSREVPMPHRIAGYAGLGIRTFGMPIYSHVIYLHPNAGRNDPGEYTQGPPAYEVTVKYKVIRLCEIEGQEILDAKLKGLIPLAPLMRPPGEVTPKDWLRQCIEVAETITMDAADKPNYLAAIAILCNVIFNFDDIRDIIPEEILMQSDVIQHFKELGIQQGTRAYAIESTIAVLNARFPNADVDSVKITLEAMQNLERLKELNLNASLTPSFEAFLRALKA